MASITSPGIGSGLDVAGLVNKLVTAEGQPVANRLDRREAKLQAQLSALGNVKSALSTFKGALANLTTIASFQKRTATSSNTELFTVAVAGRPVAGSYDVEVRSLAQAHKLASVAFDEASSAVGTGTLTFQFGDPTKPAQTVAITDENNSLTGVRDAVNAANIGVRATIVNGDDGFQLVFSAESSGIDNSLRISVEESPADGSNTDMNGLSRLAYNEDAYNMTQTAAAKNAEVYIDGIKVSSATNTVSDAIAGLTLTLKKEEAGTKATLNVALDKNSATTAVEGFVNAFNSLVGTFNQLSGYNAETKQAGVLIGDSSLRGVLSQLRSVLSSPVSGLDGTYRALADLGIKTKTDGTLELDKAKLTAALDSNFDDIGRLFAATATATDSLVSYTSSTSATTVGSYALYITQAATRGSYVDAASSVSSLVVDGSNNTFKVSVDGVSSGTISLTQKTYGSGAELAAELQSRINGDSALRDAGVSVLVSFDGTRFTFTSERYGSASKVAITEVGINGADIGLTTAGTSTDGEDVAGTIGGIAATGSGQYLTGTGAAEGLKMLVQGDTTGDRGSVTFTRGVADRLSSLLDGWLATDSFLNARTSGVQSQIDDIGKQREALAARLEALEARYMKQFTALDTLMARMQSTSNWLSNQLAALPGAYSGSNRG
ncbi:flagellar filament capping protein FliD [Sulfurivermis fontis]|uniref:flagellar filament capping protein FliD n=1 Tax=Sulfurivermis fontis TaxID=1972068 RepID=UPI000FD72C66|nr:flagellar filament capping protein FliD [Sulfurivermis fontis]